LNLSFEDLKVNLANSSFPIVDSQGLKVSSVVMPFYRITDDQIGILLTKRSEHLKSHAGQISFPGGKYDETDGTLLETALREWEEETGANRNSLEIIGSYESMSTGTGFHITPFVALYSGDFTFNVNPREVDFMIKMDLEKLNQFPFYTVHWDAHPSGRIHIYYIDLPEGLLWGATCHILYRFLRDYAGFDRKPILVKPNLNHPPFFQPPKKA